MVSVENVALDADTVIPCALIVNELVSNSLKHGFLSARLQAEGGNEIRIDLRRDAEGLSRLMVSDNGAGLPEDFQVDTCATLGLKLVQVLVKQLKGTIRAQAGCGAQFEVSFPAPR